MTFWEEKHRQGSELWLTGSSLWEIKKYHNLKDPDFRDFLDIGVGSGRLREDLARKGIGYTGVDVAPVTDHLTKNLKNIPPVRVALCHLVFQHCRPKEIERIINDVQLKRGGFLTFQFAARNKGTRIYDGPLYYYTLEEIQTIIKKTNKKLISVETFTHPDAHWYILRVK